MQQRILILTDELAPPAFAPRVVSLCKYLSENNWQCTMFSDRMADVSEYKSRYARIVQMQYYTKQSGRWKYIADKVLNRREKQFQHFVENNVSVAQFDLIFCSTCYYFPLSTTLRLAQKYHKPFVVDLRDIAEQWGNASFMTRSLTRFSFIDNLAKRLFNRLNIIRRNNVLKKANAVVTISPWHQKLLSRQNRNTHLIYNGFDPTDFYPLDIKSDKFVISYAGKIYNTQLRDPRFAMQALSELLKEQKIDAGKVALSFRIDKDSIDEVRSLTEFYHIDNIADIDTYISKTELLSFMHQSSICLVLTQKSTPEGTHGMMGTKFFEALGTEKPVLCVRNDEECMEQVINLTNAGIAASNVEQAKQFILDKYSEWEQQGFTHQRVNKAEQQLFSRLTQSAQLEQLFLSVV